MSENRGIISTKGKNLSSMVIGLSKNFVLQKILDDWILAAFGEVISQVIVSKQMSCGKYVQIGYTKYQING